MAKKERKGKRKGREAKGNRRVYDLGYYLIVTDTKETERHYFEGLRDSLPMEMENRLTLKVVETKTKKLLHECKSLMTYDTQYRIPWIVFDRDRVEDFDQIIEKAESEGIHVGWSNPCFEIWMYAYFGTMPTIYESKTCCTKFGNLYEKKTGQEYGKSEKDIYKKLITYGNEETAIKVAANRYQQHLRNDVELPSEMCLGTTVYELVGEIRSKLQ